MNACCSEPLIVARKLDLPSWDNLLLSCTYDYMTALVSEELTRFAAAPPYQAASPAAAQAAVQAACASALDVAQKLGTASQEPNWESLMTPLEVSAERIDREYSLACHLHAVAATSAWDKAYQQCVAAVSSTWSQIGQHVGLYRRLLQLRDAQRTQLSAGRQRILDEAIIDYEHSGVSLPAKQRKRFAANEQRLAQLGATFEEHVRSATAAWSEAVSDVAAFGAMPADLIAAAQHADSWQVTLLDPSYMAYMAHGTDRALRERLAQARNARASDLGPAKLDNGPLLREIMQLRWENATLLGYRDPAAQILSRRMAKDPEQVECFLNDLAEVARSHALRELEQLSSFARDEYGIERLEMWDMAFVCEQLRQRTTGIDDAQIRAYFGVNKVLDGLFSCAGRLFGISFAPIERGTWDAQVQCLQVRDAAGKPLGELFLDLYARPNKRGGAWAHGALHHCTLPGGSQQPLALINCNFTAAVAGAEARLGWDEVITLFHEAGHALHHLLSKVDDYSASGMNGVEWDAVELPSQFLENFAWRRDTALAMSAHEHSGAAMDEATFAKLEARRNFLPGMFVTRQLALASFDLELHRRRDADPLALWQQMRDRYMVAPGLENERVPCAFGHIFAGGYAAGYYGYLWADVLAADAYELFAAADADETTLGRRFAAEVLERGGTRDAKENFHALRGRAPDPAALLRRLGLS